jgi:neutral trehalase
MAKRRRARLDFGAAAMRSHMWDQSHGCFLAVNRTTMHKIETATVGGFMALMAVVPNKSQCQRMAEVLRSPSWATPLPVPTVDRRDPRFVSGGFWRGDVWPAPNYQVAKGLAAYGQSALAAQIADATIDNAIRVGISEHYDSLTVTPLGVSGLGMSAVVITMALDGLSRKHRVAIIPANS